MRIVIDCFKLVKGSGKSIGIYNVALHLVENLVSVKKKGDQIIILGTEKNRQDFAIPGVKFVSVKYNPLNKFTCILWELWMVSTALKKIKADVVVFPRGFAPIRHGCKDYVIIHDMIPFYYDEKFPGELGRVENAYIMWRLKASAKHAHGVITVSESSKEDIEKYGKVSAEKIKVIYSGVNHVMATKEETGQEIAKRLGESEYISAITSGLPHKNARGVLEAYICYRALSKAPLDLRVIGLTEQDMKRMVMEIAPEDGKKVIPHIHAVKFYEKDEDMQNLIAGSRLFVFLSKKEGFGFPPLEAMQLGVPVLCLKVSSIPEVCGDAAYYVEENATSEEIGVAMDNIVSDAACAETVQKGYKNVKRFDWKSQAKIYRETFEK